MTEPARSSTGPRARARSLGYQPALDGLRAVAVAMVLAFHLQVPGADGGYLGVSVFFTLSGFLITHLLLAELEATGRISLGSYLARRARRLLPAGLLGLCLVIVLAAAGGLPEGRSLRRSVWAALAQVANWSDLLRGSSYAELFSAPSPVAHYWSLAIEEQFYWLWPPLLLVLTAVVRRRRGSDAGTPPAESMLAPVAALFLATAVSAPLTAMWWSHDAAYLATWARAAEILAGAVLAVGARSGWRLERATPLALPALVLVVSAGALTPAGRSWPYEGRLPLFAVASAVLLAGLQGPSAVRTALSWRPVVWVGRVSYGIYVFHWPLILWLTPDRTGLDGWALRALQLAASIAAAALSYAFVESPIRSGVWFSTPRKVAPAVAMGTLTAAVLVLAIPLAPAPLPDAPLVIQATATTASPAPGSTSAGQVTEPAVTDLPGTNPPGTDPPGTDTPVTVPVTAAPVTAPAPKVVAIFGDSVPAWLLRDAAPSYDRTDVIIVNGAAEACDGFDGLPVGRDRHGTLLFPPETCLGWPVSYPATLATSPRPPDVALLMIGKAPVLDHEIDGQWRHPCDGIEWYLDDVAGRLDLLAAGAIPVVFALPARAGSNATWMVPDDVGERLACVRDQLSAFLVARQVAVLDLDEVLCPAGACDDTRGDGIHVKPELAPAVLDWVLDRTLALIG